jgi:hypothetical protein
VYPFLLIMCASVLHALELGLARHRGALTLGMAFVACAWAFIQDRAFGSRAGYVGMVGALVVVVSVRRCSRWLAEGGSQVLGEWLTYTAAPALGEFLRAVVDRVFEVFSPTPREVLVERVVEREVRVPIRDASAQMMRWSQPEPLRETAELPESRPAETAEMPVLRLVETPAETYSDWLPTSVETAGGFDAAALVATNRFGISRATYARHLKKIREQEDAA